MHITQIPALVNSTNNFGRVAENRRVCLGINNHHWILTIEPLAQQPAWEQNSIFSIIQIVSWKGTDNKMWDIPNLAWILINKWNHIEAISLLFGTLPRIWKTMNDLMKLLSKSHLKESKSNKNNLIFEIYKNLQMVLDNSYWSCKYNVTFFHTTFNF